MGFSVSGSLALVLLGSFIAVSAVVASSGNTMERLTDARGDQGSRFDAVHDTEIEIKSVTFSGTDTDCDVTVQVNNTGSSTLTLPETSLLIENRYEEAWRDGATVNGDAGTDLWLPGEQLSVTRTGQPEPPDSVSVVTKTGVADRKDTEGRTCA